MFLSRGAPQSGIGRIETVILALLCLVIGIVLLSAFFSARKTVRDAQRVSDIRQLQKALALYYKEYGMFPQASNNVAVGVENSFGRFVSPWPEAPKPADGNCTAAANAYSYEVFNNGEGYVLKFCLGDNYDKFTAGINIVSPDSAN